jgi:hypothetical protein
MNGEKCQRRWRQILKIWGRYEEVRDSEGGSCFKAFTPFSKMDQRTAVDVTISDCSSINFQVKMHDGIDCPFSDSRQFM